MKWSFATVGIIILGLIGVSIVILFQNLTTSSENDYYLLKEITEAAMFDSVDITYYRETGDLKIVKEKFVENFTRRYAESTLFIGGRYIISFFDIMEEPPKVSLLINTGIENYTIYNSSDNYSVNNSLTGIFEYTSKSTFKNEDDVYTSGSFSKTYYSMPAFGSSGYVEVDEPINIPNEVMQKEIKDGSIDITFNSTGTSNKIEDILMAKLYRNIDWRNASNPGSGTDYYEVINTNEYASSCNITSIDYYCTDSRGNKRMQCDQDDVFYIKWTGRCSGGDKAVLIIDTKWQYKEYEY